MLSRNCIAVLAVAIFASSPMRAATGLLELRVRDVQTHYSVHATVKLDGPKSLSAETDDTGSLRLTLPAGEYCEEVSAPGYQTMRLHTSVQSGKTSPMGFMLDPVNPPPEDLDVDSKLKPGFTLLHGYAVDDRGRPVAGVRVHLQKASVEATTDERGYFWLSAPTPPQTASDIPGVDTLVAEKAGYKIIVHRNIFVAGAEGENICLTWSEAAAE